MTLLAGLQAAILDLDGTLVDTLGDFRAALQACLHDLGLPAAQAARADAAFIGLTVGRGSEYLIRRTLAHVGLNEDDPALYARAFDRYQHHYGLINGQFSTVFPGVEAGLDLLRSRGWQLACLTNKPGGYARELLQRKGLAAHFTRVFGGDEFARKKPDPLPLLETCRALGTAPSATLMVGDSSNDAQAARAAGCPLVLVSYGYNHGRPIREVEADLHIDSLQELAAHLGRGTPPA